MRFKSIWFVGLVITCSLFVIFTYSFAIKGISSVSMRNAELKLNNSFYEKRSQRKLNVSEKAIRLIWSSTTQGHNFTKPTKICEFHELSCEEPYRSRLIGVRDQCKNKERKEYNIHAFQYKFSDNLKLIMCETPKVASSTLQEQMALMDPSYLQSHPKDITCGEMGNNCFLKITKERAWFKVANFTSVLMTRHPFDRVVSGYLDKFQNNKSPYYRNSVGIHAAFMSSGYYLHGIEYRKELVKMKTDEIKLLPKFQNLSSPQQSEVLEYIQSMKTGRISFPVFVRYLTHQYVHNKGRTLDLHWLPQVLVCQPCAFNYSYIMRFEDINVDNDRLVDFIFNQQDLQVPINKVKIAKRLSLVGGKKTAQEYFNQIPETQMQILRKLFEDDFEFYNYDPFLYHGFE